MKPSSILLRAVLALVALALPLSAARAEPLTVEGLDRLIDAALAKAGQKLAGPAPREELLRRASFDLTGAPPKPHTLRAVAEDASGAALETALRRYATSPGRRRLTAARISGALLGRRSRVEFGAFEDWLVAELTRDRRVFPILGRVVAASGIYPEQPETAWVVRFNGDPLELTTQLSRAALGETLGCARCHDHPFVRWRRTDFLGVAASFAQVGFAEQPDMNGTDRFRVWDRGWGEAWTDTASSISVPMKFLKVPGSTAATAPTTGPGAPPGRRAALAAWLTDPGNPMPARALANRAWGALMGRPLVTPVADLEGGTAQLPGLLDALAAHLSASGGDLEGLVDLLVRTRAYRARRVEGSAFPPRLLTLEELSAALEQLARPPGAAPRSLEEAAEEARDRLIGLLTRSGAEDLSDAPDARPTLTRALFLVGLGPLSDPASRVSNLDERLAMAANDPGVAEWLFAATLCRAPTARERAWLAGVLDSSPTRARALGDALWALINVPEFGTQH